MKEHVLSLNEFGMPRVFEESDTNYILIVRLLLLEPGIFQSHPEMGVGLKSRYRYNNSEDFLLSLKRDISSQIQKYLPTLASQDITLQFKDHILGIIIDTTDGSYVLAYDTISQEIDTAASYILDDL